MGAVAQQQRHFAKLEGRIAFLPNFLVFRPRYIPRLRTSSAHLKWAGMQSGPPASPGGHHKAGGLFLKLGQRGSEGAVTAFGIQLGEIVQR